MAEFAYNNAENTNNGHISFKLNCGYHPRISYKEEEILSPHSKSKSAEKLSTKLQKLITVCQQNLHHGQKLEK